MAFNIVLVEPEIPPNTGTIGRTCVATDSVLHLVRPLGFNIDDKTVKRAGMDYWPYLNLEVHDSLDAFMEKYGDRNLYLATTKGSKFYSDVEYHDEDMILFGKESAGLPKSLIEKYKDRSIRIPMSERSRERSINLANCANIILFEALRQIGYPNLK